jgi:AcrR family transcriptional regulator
MKEVKEYDVMKNEILDFSEELFFKKGYAKTTIVDILKKTKIAKGTFYYYFKSKEEVLDEIVKRIVKNNIEKAKKIINKENISTKDKFLKALISQNLKNTQNEKILEIIHKPENAKLNQKSLRELI